MAEMSSKEESCKYNSPLDIPYIKNLIFSLSTIGIWPHKELGGKKWFTVYRNSKLLFAIECTIFILGVSYLIKNYRELTFIDMGRNLTGIFMCFVGMLRLPASWTKTYKSTTIKFMNKIHLLHYKDQNEYAMKVFNDCENLLTIFTKLIHLELYCGLVLFNMIPIIKIYYQGAFDSAKTTNITYEQACYYDLPFDYTTNFKGFLVIYIFNWFMSFDVASLFCIYDLYILIMAIHLWGHLKILNNNLRSFPRPMNTRHLRYDSEETVKIKQLLVGSMEHYRIIKDFMDDLSMAFGVSICIYYLYHQIMGCIYLVEISQMSVEALGTYGIIALNSFQQLIQMSVVFELIGTQSETIKEALYEVPWEYMDNSNRKIVSIYLCYVQTPMDFKALGVLPIGVRTMASILKTTMSYFMLLRTFTAAPK